MIKTLLFDLDGTLLDTLADLRQAVNFALAQRGYPACTLAQMQGFVGNGVRKLIERALPADASADVDACLSDFRQYYDAHMMDYTKPYAGILQLLTRLYQEGFHIAVISNKYQAAAQQLVEHFFGDIVRLTLGERPNVPRKPDPSAVLALLEALHTAPEDALYIGDSVVDMQTAHNAGVQAIGVTWGFCSRESLQAADAAHLIDTPDQLYRYLLPDEALPSMERIQRAMKAFESHGFTVKYFDTAAQARTYLVEACSGKTVSFGGSMTLAQMELFDALQAQSTAVHWHWKNGGTPVQNCDIYITSSNGLSETGEIVNIDGRGNRVSASIYGPPICIAVCGVNKLAPTLLDAVYRARHIAAPRNAQRLQSSTPCAADGICHDCNAPARICRALTIEMMPPFGFARYELLLIGESLGL